MSNKPVEIGRVRYSSTEIKIDQERENVAVKMEPTDLLARRTALLGMSRSGKSNTIKTIATAIFRLRDIDKEKGKVGQLIFDANGEYCNDNPQDIGCLRNINDDGEDVVTYGLFRPPNDTKRQLIRINFLGETINSWGNLGEIRSSLAMMVAGKEIIDEHLRKESMPLYIKAFTNTRMEPPEDIVKNKNTSTRYKRCLIVYRAILIRAGFSPADNQEQVSINKLFKKELREAMKNSGYKDVIATHQEYASWSQLYVAFCNLGEFTGAGTKKCKKEFEEFDTKYQNEKGRSWKDENLDGLLHFLEQSGGNTRLGELKERHDPGTTSDYSKQIIDELKEGKLVIIDHSIGAPEEIKHTSERIMRKLFDSQIKNFTNPSSIGDEVGNIKPPPDIIVYIEEAHNLLPANSSDLTSIWARIAKEGSKFRIGLVFSTQEPSSILSNILKNTDNWFVAHLNNQDETKELKKYYDFGDFISQILKAPDTGFVRMRCLSNPYIVPIQVNKFRANIGTSSEASKS